ncbi:hypothetical protein ACQ4M4_25870 [Leptolyngbya sp. AN02str]|uniref:hypothetical protein n=1 Tax=Leptolyngbya sp. AN02str TaxID=3423363 RepID=UPI003D310DE2
MPSKLTVYPVERVPIPWDSSLIEIIETLAPQPGGGLSEGEFALVLLTARAWQLGLHWLVRLTWDSKHRFPLRPKLMRAYRPYGEFLAAVRELTIQCHADQSAAGALIAFPNAADWYREIVRELATADTIAALTPVEELQGDRRKKEGIRRFRLQPWVSLARYENPFDPQWMPATWLLHQVAIALAERSDIWRKKNFWPYCDAGKAWAKATTGEGYGVCSFDGQGQLRVQSGQNRSTQVVALPEPWKKSIAETLR